MFYSQFILAKKGPLGTIWIAAHLERKLRKNQVADTDISVSVDSILSPDVPIALRLSSHLLLGVVRIYSKKVNYLFNDCSEALLRIKQAFHSTAVDLPPEESTAPYHSITLPETFDLDDFELPDNAFFHGNYADHHVSAREQITLQDTIEGMAVSTSQFGLDERFGDGDASQIGLDRDEELSLEKGSPQDASTPFGEQNEVDAEMPSQPVAFTEMVIDDDQTLKDHHENVAGGCGDENNSNILDLNGLGDSSIIHDNTAQLLDQNNGDCPRDVIEGPSEEARLVDFDLRAENPADLNECVEAPDLNECAEAPSTPILIEEAAPSLNLSKRTSVHDSVEGFVEKHSLESQGPDCANLIPEESLPIPANDPCHQIEGERYELNCEPLIGEKCEALIDTTKSPREESISAAQQDEQTKLPCNVPSTSAESEQLALECIIDGSKALEDGNQCQKLLNFPSIDHIPEQSEFLDAMTCSFEASTLQASHDRPLAGGECVPVSCDSVTAGQISSKVASGIENVKHNDIGGPGVIPNVPPESVVQDLCLPSIVSPSNPNFQWGLTDKGEIKTGSHGVIRACSSSVNEPNVLPLDSGAFLEHPPGFPIVELGSHAVEAQETLARETASAKLEAENCSRADAVDLQSKLDQMQQPFPSEIMEYSNGSKEFLDGASNDKQLPVLNYSEIREVPAPETMRLAPIESSDLRNYVALQMSAGETIINEGTCDGLQTLSGKKRRLMESTPILENGKSSKFSRVLQSRSSMDYVPEDDVLASILVGGKTPDLKMKPTPPLAREVSSKQPRATSKFRIPKRKALLDDTIMLHADDVRKQLMSTEDIRRVRRKAPCTRKEIWMIHKFFLDEEIFIGSLFSGMSTLLTSTQNHIIYPTETGVPNDSKQSHLKPAELDFSKRAFIGRQIGLEGGYKYINSMPSENVTAASKRTEMLLQSENHTFDHAISSVAADSEKQTEAIREIAIPEEGMSTLLTSTQNQIFYPTEIGVPSDSKQFHLKPAELDFSKRAFIGRQIDLEEGHKYISSIPIENVTAASKRTEMLSQNETHTFDRAISSLASGSEKQTEAIREIAIPEEGDNYLLNHAAVGSSEMTIRSDSLDGKGSCLSPVQKKLIEPADEVEEADAEKLNLIENKFIENDALVPDTANDAFGADNTNCIDRVESFKDEITCRITDDEVLSSAQGCHDYVKEGADDGALAPLQNKCSVDTGSDTRELLEANLNPTALTNDTERNVLTSTATFTDEKDESIVGTPKIGVVVMDETLGQKMIDDEENKDSDEEHQETSVHTEMQIAEFVPNDSGDFEHIFEDNDTDFLNVDDESDVEADDSLPTAKDSQIIDDSGWSSRTRAVARYLKSLFDNETGRGMNMVPMGNLLAGKTRKEASRMFFETLVLKTKDYIHVEQEKPFQTINIKPRAKIIDLEL